MKLPHLLTGPFKGETRSAPARLRASDDPDAGALKRGVCCPSGGGHIPFAGAKMWPILPFRRKTAQQVVHWRVAARSALQAAELPPEPGNTVARAPANGPSDPDDPDYLPRADQPARPRSVAPGSTRAPNAIRPAPRPNRGPKNENDRATATYRCDNPIVELISADDRGASRSEITSPARQPGRRASWAHAEPHDGTRQRRQPRQQRR